MPNFNEADRIKIVGGNGDSFMQCWKADGALNLELGGNGTGGSVHIFPSNGTLTDWGTQTLSIEARADLALLRMGTNGTNSRIEMYPPHGTFGGPQQAAIVLDAAEGDIVLRNADCAEDFTISDIVGVEAGVVLTINENGTLALSSKAYDKKVAGVVSGAGKFKPGLVLDRQPELENRFPVALMGKVICKVDASTAPIEVGDLLTTSETPGHAMKAIDREHSFGSVIGKALAPIQQGQGTIPILVSLQ